jgi:hypothetical protein
MNIKCSIFHFLCYMLHVPYFMLHVTCSMFHSYFSFLFFIFHFIFSILYSLFFILYSLFFILYSLFYYLNYNAFKICYFEFSKMNLLDVKLSSIQTDYVWIIMINRSSIMFYIMLKFDQINEYFCLRTIFLFIIYDFCFWHFF